jgi:two-component system, chemotaxis family, CheB/CheR fusion protein
MAKKKSGRKPVSNKKDKFFPVVAIGASAGGLQAAQELFKKIPVNTGMAFVYIQHLDPTHASKLSEILRRSTKMPVQDAKNLQQIAPNHLYVIPPNKDMAIIDGVLTLQTRKARPAKHMPIDRFFISLAEKHKEGAIGVLLSGSANDGMLGLKAIKSAGGVTFAQDKSAIFQSMPRSAILEGVVDLVLSPGEIALELGRLGKQRDVFQQAITEDEDIEVNEEEIGNILALLRKTTGVDFSHYKRKTIRRRIIRRMLLHKMEELKDYLAYLKQHTSEITQLHQDLLINVTSFFRDRASMEYLKKTLFPRILKGKPPREPIRIWIPACSTGEEAYSIAMVLVEALGERSASTTIQIFATDLSENAISRARIGLYSENDLAEMHPKRIQRFFSKADSSYRIVKSIRDLCVFAPHNVFQDPPFSHIDVISCCNLLIYLDAYLQKKLISIFHYALKPNGYLILGKSETIGMAGQLFVQADKRYKIYTRKKEVAGKSLADINYRVSDFVRSETAPVKKIEHKKQEKGFDLDREVDNILLTRFIPASVVVNHDLEVLQFRGSTGLFLEHLPGKASLNLLKMARAEIAFELRNVIMKATRGSKPVKKSGLQITHKGVVHEVTIEVIQLQSEVAEKLYLVIFDESIVSPATAVKTSFSKDKIVKKLQDELTTVRDDLRAIIEEQEASNEELQSANEEIVSSNEELQSINEELETSKEEVESANEELMTINQELQLRNDQLAESYDYAEAVFFTIQEAVIVLDRGMRVKTANKAFYQMFKLREGEVEGHLIFQLGNRMFDLPKLRDLLENIIPLNYQFHGYEITQKFNLVGEKIMLLNARKIIQKTLGQELMLLAIEDITEHRRAQQIIAEREAWFRNMADNVPVMIWVAGPDKAASFFNKTWLDFTGRQQGQEINNHWLESIHPEDVDAFQKVFSKSFSVKKPFKMEFRLRRHDGQYRWILNMAKPNFLEKGDFAGYLISCTDIHDKKMTQVELEKRVEERTVNLEQANKELERSNSDLQQFAYVASHDLQEPLRKILSFSDRLEHREGNGLSESSKDYVQKITDSANRMSRLIDDLLNFSKIRRISGSFKTCDLNQVVKNVLSDFDTIIKQKKGKVLYKGLPVIQAIPIQMEQLFHNLISNSLKFADEKRAPVISITAREPSKALLKTYPTLQEHEDLQEIIIKDNGIGFNAGYADQIFVIFQRLNDKQEFPGTGIGLALCRKITDNHGGVIFAKSAENKGTEFHVILPGKQQ